MPFFTNLYFVLCNWIFLKSFIYYFTKFLSSIYYYYSLFLHLFTITTSIIILSSHLLPPYHFNIVFKSLLFFIHGCLHRSHGALVAPRDLHAWVIYYFYLVMHEISLSEIYLFMNFSTFSYRDGQPKNCTAPQLTSN